MGKLSYACLMSVDGYVADADGDFGLLAPSRAVHAAVNDLMRSSAVQLYGRRMYEVMAVWDELDLAGEPPEVADFARLWRASDKIVYSTQLGSAITSRTRVERAFVPDAVARLKRATSGDLTIGGPTLAAAAFAAGLVDDCHLISLPVTLGGGLPALPGGLSLRLVSTRSIDGAAVHSHYRPA